MVTWDAYEHRPPRKGVVGAKADIRPCACGGEIVVIRHDHDNVVAAMQVHQATAQHQDWRSRRGLG